MTTLIEAIRRCKWALAWRILRHPRCPNLNNQNEYGNTALHWATRFNRGDFVWHLVNNGANVNIVNVYGQISLMWAVKSDKTIAELLVRHGSSVMRKDISGRYRVYEYDFPKNTREFLQGVAKKKRDVVKK
jgi:ankyrin repeat protein